MTEPILHLASNSPRRRDILAALGIVHTYAGTNIDESAGLEESAHDLVVRLARQKALAADAKDHAGLAVLAADTVVVVDDNIFGKPTSEEHAVAMLSALSGRVHLVLTAVALKFASGIEAAVASTEIRFRNIRPDEASAYWHSGEPLGKAGAYAIQGTGGIFVERIEGSYSGVVGLPVFETATLLEIAGICVLPVAPRP